MTRSSIVSFVRRLSLKILIPGLILGLPLAFAAGCSSSPPESGGPAAARAESDGDAREDANAKKFVAEIALERGDCRTASETYAAAAATGDVAVAKRASEVAAQCEHLPAAWEAVKRWRALAPADHEAAALYATVALKLYLIPEARSAVGSVMQSAGAEPDEKIAGLTAQLLEQADATSVLAAVGGALDNANASAPVLALMAELALEAYDVKRAEQYARLALKRDASSYDAKRVIARTHVMRGDAAGAIAAAREAMASGKERGTFELVDTLVALDHVEEARHELERLRTAGTEPDEVARRLAVLAYQSGDFDEAERRFTELVTEGQATDAALLFLADLAARDGNTDVAIAGYRRLANSNLAIAARTRAAALLLAKNERAEALTLLDDYASENPKAGFDISIRKANLLSENGENDTALQLLASALERHPNHPALVYDRAVLLEKGGSVKESVQTLEDMLKDREDDPTLLNALGYTLADHDMELQKAEALIRRALQSMPDNPAVLDSLGWVRFKRGDLKEASATLERAYMLSHDAEIGAHWGEVLWKSGAQQQARQVWAGALARNPDSEHLKEILARFVPPTEKP
jgi:tetratricopeptide (TPR) repeat protein